MGRRHEERQHGTLAERAARVASRPGAAVVDGAGPVSPARHCLVDGQPGLLVQWERTHRGWEGRVISVAWLDGPAGPGWVVVERWLPATHVVAVEPGVG